MALLEYIKALEHRENYQRGQQVLAALRELGITPTVQESRFPRIRNIIVDFASHTVGKHLLFSAHYDAVKGSPGANDNASGVAVLLGLCHKLKQSGAPVRVVFFDREEVWLKMPLLKLGLLGSFSYVWSNDLRRIAAVYNLEYCGLGDFLGIWTVRGNEVNLPSVKAAREAADRLSLPCAAVHIPWVLLSSDHLSFRMRGFANAITLSLLPSAQVPVLEKFIKGLKLPRLMLGRRPSLPQPLAATHTPADNSSRLNENSLQLMLSLVIELVKSYRPD